jgi:hypothetical protein
MSLDVGAETPARKVRKLIGPLAGTPKGKYVSQWCYVGNHEELTNGERECKGVAWQYSHPQNRPMFPCFCACSCHRMARDLPLDAPSWPVEPPAVDPERMTLRDELKAWARKNKPDEPVKVPVRLSDQLTADKITDGGRRARGALELQVFDSCERYEAGMIVFGEVDPDELPYMTCGVIAEVIVENYGCRSPSTGAIHSVLTRWKDEGFALIGSKPMRFLAFTELKASIGIDGLRDRR